MENKHENHDIVSYNERFGYNYVNEGILWCLDCKKEIVAD